MRIQFPRGFGVFATGQVYDLPEPVAELHVMAGRAVRAEEPAAIAVSEPVEETTQFAPPVEVTVDVEAAEPEPETALPPDSKLPAKPRAKPNPHPKRK